MSSERPRFLPFAENIPRFPGEPDLAGPPRGLEETILFPELPGLNLAVRVLKGYRQANSEGRRHLVEETIDQILKKPEDFDNLVEAWSVLSQDEQEWTAAQVEEIETRIRVGLFREIARPKFSPSLEYFESLLPASVSGKTGACELLRLTLGNAKTIPQIVDEFYNLALAMMRLDKPEIYRFTLGIFLFQVDWLSPESPPAKNFSLARYEPDDQILEKVFAIVAAINVSAKYSSVEIGQRRKEIDAEQMEDPLFKQMLENQVSKDLDKARKLRDFYKGEPSSPLFKDIKMEELSKRELWPYSLSWKTNSLREQVARREMEAAASQLCRFAQERMNLLLPGGFRALIVFPLEASEREKRTFVETVVALALSRRLPVVCDLEPAKDLILPVERLQDKETGGIEMFFRWEFEPEDKTSYLKLVTETLKPQLTGEQIELLAKKNLELKREILLEGNHFVSPRGDIILITDDLLKKEGYRSIRFDLGEPKSKTKATIEVGEFSFSVTLDRENNLEWSNQECQLTKTGKIWLEHLVLCHLRELRCQKKRELIQVVVGKGEEKEIAEKEFFIRRRHYRELTPGWYPTYNQYLAALAEYDVDLIEHNQRRLEAGAKTFETFVFDSKPIEFGKGGPPFVLKTPQATESLNQIIAFQKEPS